MRELIVNKLERSNLNGTAFLSSILCPIAHKTANNITQKLHNIR